MFWYILVEILLKNFEWFSLDLSEKVRRNLLKKFSPLCSKDFRFVKITWNIFNTGKFYTGTNSRCRKSMHDVILESEVMTSYWKRKQLKPMQNEFFLERDFGISEWRISMSNAIVESKMLTSRIYETMEFLEQNW